VDSVTSVGILVKRVVAEVNLDGIVVDPVTAD